MGRQVAYDFYSFTDPTIKPWNVAAGRNTYALCSKEFIGFQVIMAYVNAFGMFVMTTHTFLDYLAPRGTAGAKTRQTENPVAGP